jgi:hypothetical protein
MADSTAGILAKFKEALAADSKKTAILCVLCLVLIVVIVRHFFFDSPVEPAAASTSLVAANSPTALQPGTSVRPRVEAVGHAASNRVAAVASPLEHSKRARPIAPTSEKVVSVEGLPRTLARNIFDTSSWGRFERLSPFEHAKSQGDEEESAPSVLLQVGRKLAAFGRSRREVERKIDEELAKLKLESTMTGKVPLAYISGRLVREGERFEGFSVVQILDRQVMLRKSGVTRVLTMP